MSGDLFGALLFAFLGGVAATILAYCLFTGHPGWPGPALSVVLAYFYTRGYARSTALERDN